MAERQLYIARKTVIEMLTDRGLNSKYIKGFVPSDFKIIFKHFTNFSGVFDIETKDDYGHKTIVKFIRYINDNKNSIKNLSCVADIISATQDK